MADKSQKLKQANDILNCFKKGEQEKVLLELLEKNHNSVGTYFFEMLFQLLRKYPQKVEIVSGKLYLTPSEANPQSYTCHLGEDFDSLLYIMPSPTQLNDSYKWNKTQHTRESMFCGSLSDWKELHLTMALTRLERYKLMLIAGLTPWQHISKEEQGRLQFPLVYHHMKLKEEVKKRESFRRQTSAPHFMCVEERHHLSRLSTIIHRLEHVTSP